MQTYFTGHGRTSYFRVTTTPLITAAAAALAAAAAVVIASASSEGLASLPSEQPLSLSTAEQALFTGLEHNASTVQQDITKQAGIVQDLNASRTERVPWLEKTGFPAYLAGLQDSQIKSAYKLPPKDPAKATDSDRDLARVLAAAQALLAQAYQLCNKTSPDCKMTQQRANILNEFYTGASSQAGSFRYRKEPSTLTDYFQVWQQLLAYY